MKPASLVYFPGVPGTKRDDINFRTLSRRLFLNNFTKLINHRRQKQLLRCRIELCWRGWRICRKWACQSSTFLWALLVSPTLERSSPENMQIPQLEFACLQSAKRNLIKLDYDADRVKVAKKSFIPMCIYINLYRRSDKKREKSFCW